MHISYKQRMNAGSHSKWMFFFTMHQESNVFKENKESYIYLSIYSFLLYYYIFFFIIYLLKYTFIYYSLYLFIL